MNTRKYSKEVTTDFVIKYIPVYNIAEVTWIGINHPDSQRRFK